MMSIAPGRMPGVSYLAGRASNHPTCGKASGCGLTPRKLVEFRVKPLRYASNVAAKIVVALRGLHRLSVSRASQSPRGNGGSCRDCAGPLARRTIAMTSGRIGAGRRRKNSAGVVQPAHRLSPNRDAPLPCFQRAKRSRVAVGSAQRRSRSHIFSANERRVRDDLAVIVPRCC
jgi:hypothetical protein